MLCDRLGIFVGGRLVCIGNPKQLTSRYGGYYVRHAAAVLEGFDCLRTASIIWSTANGVTAQLAH